MRWCRSKHIRANIYSGLLSRHTAKRIGSYVKTVREVRQVGAQENAPKHLQRRFHYAPMRNNKGRASAFDVKPGLENLGGWKPACLRDNHKKPRLVFRQAKPASTYFHQERDQGRYLLVSQPFIEHLHNGQAGIETWKSASCSWAPSVDWRQVFKAVSNCFNRPTPS